MTTRPKEDQNFWNFIFALFFLCVVAGAMWEVWGEYGTFPKTISIFDATIMAFAAFRITRLLVYDKIMRWFRELFVHKREFEQNGRTYIEIIPEHHGIRGTLHDLLGCPWCIGFWSALVVAFVYYMFPWAWFVILFLALAGAGSLLQLTANMIGWKAENLKLDAQEKEAHLKEMVDRSSVGK